MEMRAVAKMQCFLWGHSRSFPHIEIVAGAAAAGVWRVSVCVFLLVDCYVTPAPPAEARTRLPPPTGFLFSQHCHSTLKHKEIQNRARPVSAIQ